MLENVILKHLHEHVYVYLNFFQWICIACNKMSEVTTYRAVGVQAEE